MNTSGHGRLFSSALFPLAGFFVHFLALLLSSSVSTMAKVEQSTSGGGSSPAGGSPTPCVHGPIVLSGAIVTADPTQVGRPVRDGFGEACGTTDICDLHDTLTRHRDTYNFT